MGRKRERKQATKEEKDTQATKEKTKGTFNLLKQGARVRRVDKGVGQVGHGHVGTGGKQLATWNTEKSADKRED